MNPAFLDSMSWEMAEVYGAITDQILINLAHYFPFYHDKNLPRSAFTYQAKMLAQMGQVTNQTARIIRHNLSGADDALERILEQAIIDSVRATEPELLKATLKGIITPPGMPITVSPQQMRAFQLYYQQAANKLNLVNTVMLESTQSAYAQAVSDVVSEIELADRLNRTQIALDTAAGETVTGVSSWNQALQHATDRLKEGGITGFIDHAGRRWSAESYVAMDIRTTVANTARSAVWETNQNFGNDLYQVSSHDGARPLCYPWQGKVISSIDATREVEDIDGNKIHVYAQSETTYGQAAGLFGINCKHYPTPFIPGVSTIRAEPQDEEDNARTYEQSQEQRALERRLREEKRDLEILKAQGAPDDMIRAQRERVRNASANIDDFCKETGRARRRNREGVYTQRDFPEADKYDVTEFEHAQQDKIRQYYQNGGEQQGYTFGQMTPNIPPQPAPPVSPVPATPTPAPQNVALQATQAQPQVDTIQTAAQLDAKNFPDTFNKKKTKAFVDAVNATEGTDPDVIELFNKMGEQVKGAGYPIEISYTEDNHAVSDYKFTFSGKRVKLGVKVPKLTDPEYLRQEISTTAHEWGHLFDHMNAEKGVLSYAFDNNALPDALRNARPMSERVSKLIEEAVRDGKAAERRALDFAKAEIDSISAMASKALSEKNFTRYSELYKEREKLWKNASKAASKASRKAHNGMNAVEDIYDAISGGTLRDKTPGMYGHGSKYYGNNPGGENAAAETIANYCCLALANPELFKLMAEEQPEIWEACGNIVKAMLGR